jgi:uncharacterized membrane protein YhaH (DUF805 family)
MNWYLKVFENFANFTGRARRKEYWMFTLFHILILLALILTFAATESSIFMIIYYIYILIALVPTLAVAVRRLHDIGKSGWFYLLVFIPLVGPILMLVWFCTDSEHGKNQWGDNPKGIGNDREISMIGRE